MNIKFTLLLLVLYAAGASPARAQLNYAPNRIHIPYLTGRYDGDVVFCVGYGQSLEAIEGQVSFSPFKRIFVLAHALTSGSKIQPSTQGAYYRMAEVGGGYYLPLPKASFTLSGGWGKGHVNNGFGESRYSELFMERGFGQAAIYFERKGWSAGCAIRGVYLTFPKGGIDFSITDPKPLYGFVTIDRTSPYLFPEMGLQAGMHLKAVDLQFNLGMVMANYSELSFSMMNAGASVVLDLSGLRKEKGRNK